MKSITPRFKQIIQEELQRMLYEQEKKMSSDQARDKAINTLRQLSKRVDDNNVTNFLVDVKKWINWTLGEKS